MAYSRLGTTGQGWNVQRLSNSGGAGKHHSSSSVGRPPLMAYGFQCADGKVPRWDLQLQEGQREKWHAYTSDWHDWDGQALCAGNQEDLVPPDGLPTVAELEQESTSVAVYCKQCLTWLNGPRQWEDHKIGKKHRKNVRRERQEATSEYSPEEAAKDEAQAALEKSRRSSDMWLWLEAGRIEKRRAAKEAARKREGN